MATAKQIALRIKYAKKSLNTLTIKLNSGNAKLRALEAALKKAKTVKKPVKKKAKKR